MADVKLHFYNSKGKRVSENDPDVAVQYRSDDPSRPDAKEPAEEKATAPAENKATQPVENKSVSAAPEDRSREITPGTFTRSETKRN